MPLVRAGFANEMTKQRLASSRRADRSLTCGTCHDMRAGSVAYVAALGDGERCRVPGRPSSV